MKIKDLMTAPAEFISNGSTLQEAAQKMQSLDVGSLPVCEGDRLIGILTDRDVTVRGVARGEDPKACAASKCMSPELVVCYEDQEAPEAERLMQERRVRRLPVLDRDQHLVGMVSLGDLATRHSERCGVAYTLEVVSEPA
jgi:CBS domain-containing protein